MRQQLNNRKSQADLPKGDMEWNKMCRQTGVSRPLPGGTGTAGLAGVAVSQANYLIGPYVLRMLKSDLLKNWGEEQFYIC